MRRSRLLNENNDIFTINGKLQTVIGADQVLQSIRVRLLFYLGEYILDNTVGFDWYGLVLRKDFSILQIESAMKNEILNTPGVTALNSFSLDFDAAKRKINIKFSAVTDEGVVVDGEVTQNG